MVSDPGCSLIFMFIMRVAYVSMAQFKDFKKTLKFNLSVVLEAPAELVAPEHLDKNSNEEGK
jgi:hypothetical protein